MPAAPIVAMKDGLEWVDLEDVKPSEAAVRLAPGDFALKHQVLPLEIGGDTPVGGSQGVAESSEARVAMSSPSRA